MKLKRRELHLLTESYECFKIYEKKYLINSLIFILPAHIYNYIEKNCTLPIFSLHLRFFINKMNVKYFLVKIKRTMCIENRNSYKSMNKFNFYAVFYVRSAYTR